eukprot:gene9273-1547_t
MLHVDDMIAFPRTTIAARILIIVGAVMCIVALALLLARPSFHPPEDIIHANRLWIPQGILDPAPHKATKPPSTCNIALLTTVGGTYSTQRMKEVVMAIQKNSQSLEKGCTHVLLDGPHIHDFRTMLSNASVVTVTVSKQPMYKDMIEYANNHLNHSSIVFLSNADIVVDFTSLPSCTHEYLIQNYFFALTRHPWPNCPKQSGGGVNPKLPQNLCTGTMPSGAVVNSADTFAYIPPLKINLSNLNFVQNIRGAENRFIYHLKQAGYKIANPCSQIKTYHMHCTKERSSQSSFTAPRADSRYHAENPRTKITCNGYMQL